MTNEEIEKIALASGFKLKRQDDGSMALNPYVYTFAQALLDAQMKKHMEIILGRKLPQPGTRGKKNDNS